MTKIENNTKNIAKDLLSFIKRSPTPFHATKNLVELFLQHGFTLLNEAEPWQITKNSGYIVTRNDSSIIAFRTGDDLKSGINMIGAHTDSPCLRIKPNADINKHGYTQLGVEVYGGVLLHPWLDRDLSIAGRVSGVNKDGSLFHELIDLSRCQL